MRRAYQLVLFAAVAASGLGYMLAKSVPQIVMPADAAVLPSDLVHAVQNDPDTPIAGNPVGAVTVVEFFDYRCPYCRLMQPRLEALAGKDKRVRLVFKDWPIFGGPSIYAARVSIAAQWQGKYAEVHKALFALPRSMDEAAVRNAAARAGLDMTRLDRDLTSRANEIDTVLRRTDQEARTIGFQGTPGMILGTIPIPGAMSESEMEKLVNQAAER